MSGPYVVALDLAWAQIEQTGIFIPSASSVKRIKKAKARVRAGTGRGLFIVGGDSTQFGQGAGTGANQTDGAYEKNTPRRLAEILNGRGLSATCEGFLGDGNRLSALADYNTRLTIPSGWDVQGTTATIGGMMLFNNSNTNALAYAPPVDVDTFGVYSVQNPTNQADFTLDIDGGSATTITATGTAALAYNTKTATLGSHTLNIKRSGVSGSSQIIGIRPYNSAVPAIDILAAGWPSSRTTNWSAGASDFLTRGGMVAITADAIFLKLGINDMINDVALATSLASLQTIITAVQPTKDIVLIAPNRISNSTGTDVIQDAYKAALIDLCVSNEVAMIDPTAFIPTYTEADDEGYMYDTLHPNDLYYAQEADLIATFVLAA